MTTGFDLHPEKDVVAIRVDGALNDLATEVTPAQTAEPVTIDSDDGLNILRHSTAHILAQAVQRIDPTAKLGIGPFIPTASTTTSRSPRHSRPTT